MTGQTLVVGQRGQRPLRPDRGVGQVDVVGAGSGTIQAAGLRVTTRCPEFDGRRHPAHLDRCPWQHAEQLGHATLDRLHLHVQVGKQLGATVVVVRVEPARLLAERGHASPDCALAEPLRLQQCVGFGRDLGHLREAERVRFVGRHARGGLVTQAERVIGLASRTAADTRLVAGARPLLRYQRDLCIERSRERAVDDPLRPCAPVAGKALLGRAPRKRAHQRGFLARLPAQRPELHQRLVGDEIRRNDAALQVIARPAGVVADFAREGVQPRQIGLGIGGRFDRVLGRNEIGRRLVGACLVAMKSGVDW